MIAQRVLPRSLLPDTREEAADRLAVLALLIGIALVAATLLRRSLAASGSLVWDDSMLVETVWSVVAGSSLVLYSAWRLEVLSASRLLWLGLPYEVGLSFALVLGEHAVVGPALEPRLSMGAVVLLTFPLVVPASPVPRALTSLASFLAVPLAMTAAGTLGPASDAADATMALVPTFAAAVIGLASSRIAYGFDRALDQVRRAESYTLIARIGSGGMGEVWRAEHRRLARPAAVKLVLADRLRQDPERFLARFEREAQAIASLSSPHIVTVYDFGVADDGTLYYAMELLEGTDLETRVRRDGPLPEARVRHLLRQAAEGLAEAHERGLLHRDIKPANLFVGPVGIDPDFLKILDFGLVELVREPDDDAPAAEAVGTPGYAAPEAFLGGPIDARSDVYGLGAVAYWLLTGRRPFAAHDPAAIVAAQVSAPPPSPSSVVPELSPELDALVRRCLAIDPEERPASAREVLLALCPADDASSPGQVASAKDELGALAPRTEPVTRDDTRRVHTRRGRPP